MDVNGSNDNKPLPPQALAWLAAPDRIWSFRPYLNIVAYEISSEMMKPVSAHFNTDDNRVELRFEDNRLLAEVEFQPSLQSFLKVVIRLVDEVTEEVKALFQTLFYQLIAKDIHFVGA